MAQRRGVEVAELRDRERRRGEREAQVRIGELRAQAVASGERDRLVVERHLGQRCDRVPGGVVRHGGIEIRRNEPQVGGCELPLARVSSRVAERHELLEVGELADVHLHGQMTADRLLERLPGVEIAAGE